MRIYETTFIVNPQMEEATIDRQIKAVADTITQNGGNILQETTWELAAWPMRLGA